ncbi:peptide deformylase [bacterium]|nr:peptide deformylase [bacterium]
MKSIVTYPDPVLRRKVEPVGAVDDEIRKLIPEMAQAMYSDDGVGLAAPQIGESRRVIVVDAGKGFRAVINPEIEFPDPGDTESMEEGCLSLPDVRVEVKRPKRILLSGLDENGNTFAEEHEGLMARVFQHEYDHLNGVLIIDYASSIQRALMKSKLRRMAKTA